ncbi:MAG TPA: hypothetical protein VM261_26100 [Kofleriaceae bacterium]|nr:hypothetical protein [Kofleriaceae bacterium]
MRASLAMLVAAAAAAIAACGGPSPGERELLGAIGDEVDLIAVIAPRRVAGTWVERAAYTLVPDVPACVRERARRASVVAITWDQSATDVLDGTWSLVMIGGGAAAELPSCNGLERGDAVAWYGADPRGGTRKFFAAPEHAERTERWRALGGAPVRVIGDVQAQPGIAARVGGTVDPRDGVDASVTVRFDERAAASGALEMLQRARRRLDRERLGGAWPAFQWKLAADPTDARGAALHGELAIAGARGEEAMLFAAAAIASGAAGTPGAPCHIIGEQWEPNIRCAEPGRYTVSVALRDQLLGEPMILDRDARVVPAIKNGASSGFKVYAIRPGSLLAALGFENGDRIHTVAGVTVTDMSAALQLPAVLRATDRFTIEIERRGREVALRYDVR